MRLLFLAPRIPYPPDRGDRIRSWQLLKYFAERCDVDLACTADECISEGQREALAAVCNRVAIAQARLPRWWSAATSMARGRSATEGVFHRTELCRTIAEWNRCGGYDRVFVYCTSMLPYLRFAPIEREQILVDLVDVDSRKWHDLANTARGIQAAVYRIESGRICRLERLAAELSHRLLVTTDDEARMARQQLPDADLIVLRNGVDLEYFGATPALSFDHARSPTCIFTGVLDYPPNVQGIQWFVDNVWGTVRERFSNARLLIVGRNPTSAVRKLTDFGGVELRANVADVRTSLAESHLVVAPLQIARGIQNKVLEGMAARRAVIASPQAAVGLDIVAGTELLVAHHPQTWVAAIEKLTSDAAERHRLATAGRRYVELHHRWESQLYCLDSWLGLPSISKNGYVSRPAAVG